VRGRDGFDISFQQRHHGLQEPGVEQLFAVTVCEPDLANAMKQRREPGSSTGTQENALAMVYAKVRANTEQLKGCIRNGIVRRREFEHIFHESVQVGGKAGVSERGMVLCWPSPKLEAGLTRRVCADVPGPFFTLSRSASASACAARATSFHAPSSLPFCCSRPATSWSCCTSAAHSAVGSSMPMWDHDGAGSRA
jgi:hypothetical protein